MPAAEELRTMLDASLNAAGEPEDKDAWKKAILNLKGIWTDREDIQDEMRDLRKGSSRRLKRLGLEPEKTE